jgi:hypothetical protein
MTMEKSAPSCPRCGKPVSEALNQSVPSHGFPEWTGIRDHLTWNTKWDGKCAGCGVEFRTSLQIESGHHGPASSAARRSIVHVRGGESVHMAFDFWDHQPVIAIEVERSEPGNAGDDELPARSNILLTIEEWKALREQLEGPLKPLLERRAWSRDTT